jgi:hypothetical protein
MIAIKIGNTQLSKTEQLLRETLRISQKSHHCDESAAVVGCLS